MWFKKKTDNDEIDFDNDVAPILLPQREKTLSELLSEVLVRIEKIEKKIDQILTESPK
jgi:hypothetical protein